MLIMSFSNVPKKKKKRKEENNIFFLYKYICIACVPCHDSLFFVCVCVIPFYISVSHAQKRKKKKSRKAFLACMLCFPKSGYLPFDISLIMHTYARGCTCTDHICKKQFSGVPSPALNLEKHTEHKS